jgi:cation diffusion facilitator CzcD-associated flavoprotein CzcO
MGVQDSFARATHSRVAIIGSGFSGLGMAIQLKKAGDNDFVMFEKEGGVGGTWRVNHYPGCACDVQSHLYSFSFEQNPEWSRMFAPQPEIRAYLERCAEKYQLAPHLRLNSEIISARWDEGRGVWRIKTAAGAEHTAQVLVSGMGGLSVPSYPELPGLETFEGKTFHSQQWDHGYDLSGKRVAVIGTGASAIQFVPQIQPKVAQLDLYQRTPPWIIPKPDRAVTAREKWTFRHFPRIQKAFRGAVYALMESQAIAFTVNPRLMSLGKRLALSNIRRGIKDPALRRKVTPDYTVGCKRVLISDNYYPALEQPNVDVLTTGIREVRRDSIVTTDGVERKVDAILFGTGFRATDPLPRGVVFGRNGQDLLDAWKDGPQAYKGAAVAGFPNLFFLMGPNTGLGHNSMVYMIESQIAYVMDALRLMDKKKLKAVEVRVERQQKYNEALQEKSRNTVWTTGGCKSWYLHPVSGKNVTLWPGFTWKYRLDTRRFDAGAYRLSKEKSGARAAAILESAEGVPA